MTQDPTPTLKCVIAWSDRRHLCDIVGEVLGKVVPAQEVRRLGDEVYIVNTSEEPATLRDLVRSTLTDHEGVLVIDFERWSGYGQTLESEWLLRRGH